MRTIAVVPVKPLAEGKSRLAGLSPAERSALNRRLFARLTTAIRATGLPIAVVSRDADVHAEAAAAGAVALDESGGPGLNPALEVGRRFALDQAAEAILVLPADLPWIEAADIRALLAAAGPPAVVIAPDEASSGTNALLLAPPDAIPFRFGTDSFALHIAAARAAGLEPAIVRRAGLAFDLDRPADLARLGRMPADK